jgi:hypothetical protein
LNDASIYRNESMPSGSTRAPRVPARALAGRRGAFDTQQSPECANTLMRSARARERSTQGARSPITCTLAGALALLPGSYYGTVCSTGSHRRLAAPSAFTAATRTRTTCPDVNVFKSLSVSVVVFTSTKSASTPTILRKMR